MTAVVWNLSCRNYRCDLSNPRLVCCALEVRQLSAGRLEAVKLSVPVGCVTARVFYTHPNLTFVVFECRGFLWLVVCSAETSCLWSRVHAHTHALSHWAVTGWIPMPPLTTCTHARAHWSVLQTGCEHSVPAPQPYKAWQSPSCGLDSSALVHSRTRTHMHARTPKRSLWRDNNGHMAFILCFGINIGAVERTVCEPLAFYCAIWLSRAHHYTDIEFNELQARQCMYICSVKKQRNGLNWSTEGCDNFFVPCETRVTQLNCILNICLLSEAAK